MLIHLPSPCDISEEMACLKFEGKHGAPGEGGVFLSFFLWRQTNSHANSTRKACANQTESIWGSLQVLAPLSPLGEKHQGRKSYSLTPALCHAAACSVLQPGNLAAATHCCLINALSASAHAEEYEFN